ncbi:MAG TPA: T9SS type A sorting domain-containing protein, partial [Candidatus Kapabacteria bacterium]
AAQPAETFSVLPEPNGSLRIVMPPNTKCQFELIDILGERVWSGTIAGTQSINVGTLPLGTYFYRLTSGTHNESGKILLGE